MKRQVLLAMVCILLFSLVGCANKEVKSKANEAVDAFAVDDIQEINRLIFDTGELKMDSEIKDIFGVESDTKTGVLGSIFTNSTLSVKKVEKDAIKYEITAPDLENVFKDLPDNNLEFTEDDLINYINKSAENAELKNFLVSVPYTINDDKIVIDYQNKDFINAISGGLLNAYIQLCTDTIKEYREGGK